MKSFQNFANNIVEAEAKPKTKVNIIAQEILPMQPEGETSKPKTKVVKQSKVSADIKSKSVEKKKAEAIKKGYVNPQGRVQEKGVVTNRIRAAALGYGDKGKDPSKYGINPSNVAAEKGTLFKRATSPLKPERIAARKEIKTAVKSIEKRYPGASGRTDTSFRGFSRSVSQNPPSRSDISTLQRMARPETSSKSAAALSSQLGKGAVKRGQAASDAAKDIASYEKQTAYHKRILKAIDKLPPEPTPKPKSSAPPTPPKPPKLDLSKYKVKTFDPSTFKPVAAKATGSVTKTAASTASDIGKAVSDVLSKERAARAAEKAAATAKGWKTATKLAAPVAAAFDAKGEYEAAKKTGSSETRALGAGAAKAVGGLVGGAIGSTLGSAAGPVGTFAGGTAGYTAGSELASKAYKAVTGDPGKKLTTQGVLTNIRKTVPQEIRAKVPTGARKAFTDFVKQTGRAYGNWRKSQQQGANK